MIRHDYLGRPVCASCGHTHELHPKYSGSVCSAAGCYCRAFSVRTPAAAPAEAVQAARGTEA